MTALLVPQSPPSYDGRARPTGHMDQLDALRAFAVLAVLLCHFATSYVPVLWYGQYGVNLFFVLSGFLITGILLRCRRISFERSQSRFLTIRQFYVRRFLRIFPLFYFVLIVTWIIGIDDVRHAFGWHVTYLTDFYIFRRATFGGASHFWSLAVEEQFYLLWPWAVIFLPFRWLLPVTAAAIGAAPITRMWGALHGWSFPSMRVFPVCSTDALGLGALLAICAERAPRMVPKLARMALRFGIALLALWLSLRRWHSAQVLNAAIFDLGCDLVFSWFVVSAAAGFTGAAGRLLTFRPLLLIGVISYGIYVYHVFAPELLIRAHLRSHSHTMNFGMDVAISFLLPLASWYCYERPINELKRHFPYALCTRRRESSVAEVAVSHANAY